jgi:prepilin-type N-terminal cleavage/methylation domain-containing protein
MRVSRRDRDLSEMAAAKELCYSSRMLRRNAFTLIELLLVIGIIAVVAGIVIAAVNPQTRLASATDAKRRADARTIQQALQEYLVDYSVLPDATSIPSGSERVICSQGLSVSSCLRLDDDLVPTHIAALPRDSTVTNSNYSGFAVSKDSQGRPSVVALNEGKERGAAPNDYVARWTFQDSDSSTALVATVGANLALVGGDTTATNSTTGPGLRYPRAIQFDGTNDTTGMIGHPLYGKSEYTMALWAKPSAHGNSTTCVLSGEYSDGHDPISLGFDPSGHARIEGDLHVLGGSVVLSTGTWHHLAVTQSASEVTLYVNGIAVQSVARSGAGNSITSQLRVAAWRHAPAGTLFNGAIADIRLYERALSPAEVAAVAVLN